MNTFQVSSKKLYLLFFVWAIPVALFVIDPSYSPKAWPVWLATIISIFLGLKERRFFTFSLPFFAFLSPLAISGRLFNLLPSELYVLGCFFALIGAFLIKGVSNIKLRSGESYLIWMLVIVFISYLFSFEHALLNKSIIRWGMIFTVFCLTRVTITNFDDVYKFFTALLMAAAFSSLITFSSFLNGLRLATFINPFVHEKNIIDIDLYESFFRASYFYTNILYVFGLATFISFFRIIGINEIRAKLLYICFFTGFIGTLLIMIEKTGLVSIAISLIITLMLSVNQKVFWRSSNLIYIFFAVPLAVYFIFMQITKDTEFTVNLGSLNARICVIFNAMKVLFQNPLRLFFGFGPDSANLLNNDLISAAKTSCGGTVEGAIDSGHMTFLFEYGFVFVILFWLFSFHGLSRIFNKLKSTGSHRLMYITIISLIIFINIAALSDVMGTSKVTWIIVQIFAVIGLCISKSGIKNKNFVYKSAL